MKSVASLGPVLGLWIAVCAGTASAHSFDQQYLDTMMRHHEEAVRMSIVGQSKVTDPSVRELLHTIQHRDEAELDQMRDLREDLFGDEPVSYLDAGEATPAADLEGLAPGPGADRVVLQAMMQSHDEGMRLSREACSSCSFDEVRQLAERLVEVQGRELDQMRAWQSQWGQDGRGRRRHHHRHRWGD